MLWNRGGALVAACVGSLLLSSLVYAQVQWKTTINPSAEPVALSQQSIASASDGSIYSVSYANSNRIRVSRTASGGSVQWTRWLTGGLLAHGNAPLIHPDNSISVVYDDNLGSLCVINFLTGGDVRTNYCFSDNRYSVNASVALDGDLIIASGWYRAVRKLGVDGTNRWTTTEAIYASDPAKASGIDSDGNYFELQPNRLRRWKATDGLLLADTQAANYRPPNYSLGAPKFGVARNSAETVAISDVSDTPNAVTTKLIRYGNNGVARWTRDIVFAGYNNTGDTIGLFTAPSDDVYVVRTPSTDGNSEIARISASGAIVWQRNYSRISRLIDTGTGLLAIRTDVTASDSNSYIFTVAASDGALSAPVIYTRADSFASTAWFAVTGGVIAAFQGSNPFPPFAGFPASLQATNTFIGITSSNRWVNTAEVTPDTSISQSDCLMPRLGMSSPATRWARTQPSRWTAINPTSGAVNALAPDGGANCGYPMTSDGGRVAINSIARASKVSAAGEAVWQATSATYPQSYGDIPLQVVSPNDETTYAFGSLLGRVSATGTIIFETETSRANPRYLAVDSTNNAWVVSAYSNNQGYVSKVSPAGALLWSISVDTPACNDVMTAARLTASNEMIVATQSCGEGRVFKFNASGAVVWQRLVSGTAQRPYVELKALHEDASGNIYVGGCFTNPNSSQFSVSAASTVSSWTATGSERWSATTNLIAVSTECVTSIVTDSSNNVFASASSTEASSKPVLWSLSNSGSERWRHDNVLASPNAAGTEMTMDSATTLIALGEALPNVEGGRVVTLRKINVNAIGSALRLKFLEAPTTLISYQEPFSVRIGLRNASDIAINATVAAAVKIGLENGIGKLQGMLACTIAVGTSECTVNNIRYDAIENGVTLSASSDGFPAALSSAIGFKRAATTTTLSTQAIAPYAAYSVVRIRASARSTSPAPMQGAIGQLNGPFTNNYAYPQNCAYNPVSGDLATVECDFRVRAGNFPMTASYSDNGGNYENSTATPFTLSLKKVVPSIDVVEDPDNTYVTGDRLRFRVALRSGGLNLVGIDNFPTLSISDGYCNNRRVNGDWTDGYTNSYLLCEVPTPSVGSLTVNFNFPGDEDLLPAAQVSRTVAINAGAVFRSSDYLPSGVTACSPTPNVTCTSPITNGGWQCVGPAGMSGSVFFVPAPGSAPYFSRGTPLQFSGVSGVVETPAYFYWESASSSCNLDVDGDGARMMMTDGILILRRMLGFTGTALTNGATHACVPRTASGIASAINVSAYDVDGDGLTRPETDGLLLLRAMLGFTGNALIANAVSPAGTRKNAVDIVNWFRNTCNLYIP